MKELLVFEQLGKLERYIAFMKLDITTWMLLVLGDIGMKYGVMWCLRIMHNLTRELQLSLVVVSCMDTL